ncbi:hypothetical protein PanWU01x14_022250 [Parasponia andersonii]|uniref:Uncharacterized protein n=1 Tax=Parasponia andersonii TaxID=3476 RepID=A0A2P5DX63_PARAD|nr:hypothetical protein PanWU01x14_022250 [Parasponia andersonii]
MGAQTTIFLNYESHMGPNAGIPAALHAQTTSRLPSGLLVTMTTSDPHSFAASTLISDTMGRPNRAVSCTITLSSGYPLTIPLISFPKFCSILLATQIIRTSTGLD